MEYNYIEVLQDSLDMWIWLYQNPGKVKGSYLKYNFICNKYNNACPLCAKFIGCENKKHKCIGHLIGKSCFNGAYCWWACYHDKASAAYIASKIRRELRKELKIIIEVVNESIKIWEWLYNNPDKEKEDYPGYSFMLSFTDYNYPLCNFFHCAEMNNKCPGQEPYPCFGDNYKNWINGYQKKESANNILKKLTDYIKEIEKCRQTVTGN